MKILSLRRMAAIAKKDEHVLGTLRKCRDGFACLRQRLVVHVRHTDPKSALCEALAEREADPARAAGHYRDASCC